MRGSLIVNFDENVSDLGAGFFTVVVNGNETYRGYFGMPNLWSSKISIGDVVTVTFNDTVVYSNGISVVRVDYTTDDEGGDLGIKETQISQSISNSITFTVSTRNDSYGFEYLINNNITTNFQIWTEASEPILTENSEYINQQF